MTDNFATKLSAADVQAIFDRSPFIGWLGLQVVSLDHERQEIVVRMAMRSELERRPGTGQFHGGPIAAFIDIGGFCDRHARGWWRADHQFSHEL